MEKYIKLSSIFPSFIENDNSQKTPIIRNKGDKITTFPDNYTIIDLETTGLSPLYDSIIEFGAIKVKNNKIIDTYQQLINPGFEISDFITDLTGITNDMLKDKPLIENVIYNIIEYIGDDIVVGHNVNFDVNFLYDNLMLICEKEFSNSYIDTMRFSRKLHKELKHHRLSDMIDFYNIQASDAHRALADCYSTFELFNQLKIDAIKEYGNLESFSDSFKKKSTSDRLKKIESTNTVFDTSHPLFDKLCVFTGTLEKMKRADAAQIVVDFGGQVSNGITKKTNYLILGNNDYCSSIKDGKSSKQKKAEELIHKGCDLKIISEDVFYDLILEEE